MKERWRYWDWQATYYKTKQCLTWRFYIRIIKEWFTPCKKCQDALEELWYKVSLSKIVNNDLDETPIVSQAYHYLCQQCKEAMELLKKHAREIILGNKEYEPALELSRTWLDDDNQQEKVSETEYRAERPYLYL